MLRAQSLAAFLATGLTLCAMGVRAQTTQETTPSPPAVSKECGETTSSDRPLPNSASALQKRKRVRILAIGASSTAVLGLGGRTGSPLLERILERTVKGLDVEIVNRGFSGELADAAGERIRLEVGLNAPDIVLWQVGTNDALAQVPVDSFEQSVGDTVRWLKEHNVDLILVGLHYAKRLAKDPHYQAIRMALRRVETSENVLRIGRYEAMEVLARSDANPDRPVLEDFGLTEAGYNCMAQYIARTIAVGLFDKRKASSPAGLTPRQ
jgi:lysophospholipase L1-like esterase